MSDQQYPLQDNGQPWVEPCTRHDWQVLATERVPNYGMGNHRVHDVLRDQMPMLRSRAAEGSVTCLSSPSIRSR